MPGERLPAQSEPRSRRRCGNSTPEDRESSSAPSTGREDRGRAPLPGRPRLADRPARPAPLPRRARPVRLLQRALRRPGRGDDHRHRRPQGGQRQPRPPRRRQPDPQIANVLRERVRATDIVARLSGDELAVLMPQTDVEGAMQLGEDLRAQVAESARPAPESDPVTISVGIAMFGGERQRRPRGGPDRRRRGDVRRQGGRPQPGRPWREPAGDAEALPGAEPDGLGADPRRPHPRPPQPPHASRSAASPRAASSATSCCCG